MTVWLKNHSERTGKSLCNISQEYNWNHEKSREVKISQDKSREVIVVARYIALRILGKNCTWIIHFWMCATARCLPNSNACMHACMYDDIH